MALVAQRCEQLGIKTTLAFWHIPLDTSDASGGIMMFNMPELDAIVSMGTPWESVSLPPMDRTIGTPIDLPKEPHANGKMSRMLRWIRGAQDQLGSARLKAAQY